MEEVKAGNIDMGFGSFEKSPGVRRTPFFRFSLMVIRPEYGLEGPRPSCSWSALRREKLILQAPPAPSWRVIGERLSSLGIGTKSAMLLNRLDTVVSMVEAGHGVGIVPSFALPVCQYRKVVMTRLVNPTVNIDFYQIRNRGRKLSEAADDFASFLQGYIGRWAGRAGIPS
jgi:LysR family transcriptional regulator, carnitine catabolism transcriptional activator